MPLVCLPVSVWLVVFASCHYVSVLLDPIPLLCGFKLPCTAWPWLLDTRAHCGTVYIQSFSICTCNLSILIQLSVQVLKLVTVFLIFEVCVICKWLSHWRVYLHVWRKSWKIKRLTCYNPETIPSQCLPQWARIIQWSVQAVKPRDVKTASCCVLTHPIAQCLHLKWDYYVFDSICWAIRGHHSSRVDNMHPSPYKCSLAGLLHFVSSHAYGMLCCHIHVLHVHSQLTESVTVQILLHVYMDVMEPNEHLLPLKDSHDCTCVDLKRDHFLYKCRKSMS